MQVCTSPGLVLVSIPEILLTGLSEKGEAGFLGRCFALFLFCFHRFTKYEDDLGILRPHILCGLLFYPLFNVFRHSKTERRDAYQSVLLAKTVSDFTV